MIIVWYFIRNAEWNPDRRAAQVPLMKALRVDVSNRELAGRVSQENPATLGKQRVPQPCQGKNPTRKHGGWCTLSCHFASVALPVVSSPDVPLAKRMEMRLSSRNSAKIIRRLSEEKELAATAALLWVRSMMTLGLGSGSTSAFFITALGKRVRAGELRIEAVASSRESEAIARTAGIPLLAPRRGLRLDLAVDSADEITPGLDLLKGRGGAMLREKIVAQAARYFLVIGDSSKRVQRFGRLPVPVEVVPFALPWVADRIAKMGGRPILRTATTPGRQPYRTDQKNYVLDCRFSSLRNPDRLAERLERIPGVVAHGLFLGCAQAALIAEAGEVRVFRPGRAPVRLQDFSVTL